jgi:hypothetical protein
MGTMELQSPLAIPHEDIQAVNSSEAFCVLRSYLARDAEYVFPPPRILQLSSLSESESSANPRFLASAHNTRTATTKQKKHGFCTATSSTH